LQIGASALSRAKQNALNDTLRYQCLTSATLQFASQSIIGFRTIVYIFKLGVLILPSSKIVLAMLAGWLFVQDITRTKLILDLANTHQYFKARKLRPRGPVVLRRTIANSIQELMRVDTNGTDVSLLFQKRW